MPRAVPMNPDRAKLNAVLVSVSTLVARRARMVEVSSNRFHIIRPRYQ